MHILIVGGLLILFGIFSIYSVSIFESFDLTLGLVEEGLREDPSNYYYFLEQLSKLGFGLVLSGICFLVPLKVIKKFKYILFFSSLALVFLLFVPSLGRDFDKGATLWLDLGGFTIQPGEFFKIGFVMFLADWLVRKKKILEGLSFYLSFLVIVGLCAGVFLFLPDGGTLLLLGSVSLVMFWYGGGKIQYILVSLLIGLVLVIIGATQFGYIRDRVQYFIDPNVDQSQQGIGRQTKQSLIAVGGGKWIGKGYGKGLQKFGYIPEAQSDFIFAAFSEEIGFIGNSILLTLYFLLAYYFLIHAHKIKDEYDKVLGIGLLAMIMMQVFINIGVNIKLLPLTGLTLPFVSHGGSALIVNMIEVVLMQKILLNK